MKCDSMNVGIITFSSAHNYGAMLQTYALQKTIKKMGFEVKIINFRPNVIDNVYNPFRRKRRGYLDFKFYKHRIGLHTKNRFKIRKFENFEEFMKDNFNLTDTYKTFHEIVDANLEFDFFITGSDQVWNHAITKGLNPAYFLKFAPDNSKKISYGVSIGSDNVDIYDIPLFKHYLQNLDDISIREKSSLKSLSECSDKDIDIVIDPTLLLERKYYDDLKVDMDLKDKEYIFVYTLENNEEIIKIAQEISEKEGLPIIFNRPYKKFEDQLRSVPFIGPKEFLGVLKNAKYVVTNSFHGVVFSIIYNKTFVTVPNTKTPQRVEELIGSLGLEQVLFYNYDEFKDINNIKIDYANVESKLKVLKDKSLEFLEKSLIKKEKANINLNLSYLDDNDKFKCYGCYACKEICPDNAIEMITDNEGFVYPKINENLCGHCNICRKICIYSNDTLMEKNTNIQKVFAGYNKYSNNRAYASSGGLFLSLSKNIISSGGYVVGAKYTDDMEVKHDIVKNLEESKDFSGSKYVKSDISDLFPKIKDLLDKGKVVMFTGVPCQVAGLKSYLNKYHDNLYLVEILCHSNPSPKVFKKYISYLEDKFNDKVIDFKFKDKTMGWNNPSVLIKFRSGKTIRENGRYNNYNRGFQTSLFPRPCCSECEFVYENRPGDITIADFWGIEKYEESMKDDLGVSLIITNTSKGNSLFNEIKPQLKLKEENMEKAFANNHKHSIVLNRRRTEFFLKLDEEPIDELLYSFNNIKQRYKKHSKK
ncbi:polysaccharide pyruvyl transferase family protein [Methanobrevibacter filiformis]|uniref:F420H2 dehydrogenase subunit F n=1 Tax=Methanobrevibacter filiformis TaxID=55758 RepID=A0A166F4L7_9EURY|nr:polysaccharide pyruvyl transferase family protein [Methanobrevibacter filiformis]KZX17306.1 F420H2 dehydrogenase subunit F [Methanobrevibacter filiformis]